MIVDFSILVNSPLLLMALTEHERARHDTTSHIMCQERRPQIACSLVRPRRRFGLLDL